MNEKLKKSNYLFAFLIGLGISGLVLNFNQAHFQNYEYPTGKTYSISGVRKQESRESWAQFSDSWTRNRAWNLSWYGQTIGKWDWGNKEPNQTGHKPVLRTQGFGLDTDATKIINYAYDISSGDMDFVLTLKAENGWFDLYQQSNVYNNGIREDSWGLCQLNRRRHKNVVDNPLFRESWEHQVEVCWDKYKNGTKFYGYNVRKKYENLFYWE